MKYFLEEKNNHLPNNMKEGFKNNSPPVFFVQASPEDMNFLVSSITHFDRCPSQSST